jgi:pyrimidine operon attenuation protein/uracil phosphoribosyltransferase
MSNKRKRIVILTEVELRKTLSRLTSEIIEKVKNLENLILVGIPTRGIDLAEVLEKELFFKTGLKVRKGIIDPTFYRDDQNRVGTRLIKATEIPTPIEKQEILLIDDVIFTGRTIRAAMDALYSWGRPQRVLLLVMIDRGHRELPIQPDFCGKKVPTSKNESISLRLNNIDNEEGVFLQSL